MRKYHSKKTIVEQGDRFEFYEDRVILLYDNTSQMPGLKAVYAGDKVITKLFYCNLFDYAMKSRNVKLMQLFVDLLERNRAEFFNCLAMPTLLRSEKIPVPVESHCFSCLEYQRLRLKTSQQKPSC